MTTRGYKRRQARFPEIGAIRKGAPKTDKGHVGKDLDYFRVEFDADDPRYEQMENIFREHYGDEPRLIDVMLPFPAVDENFTASREAYLASGLVFRGTFWADENDDYFVEYKIDLETGERFFPENERYDPWSPVGEYESKKKKKIPYFAKPRGRLRVIIPILKRLAFLTLRTGSTWDINFLDEQLRAIEYFQGNLTCIPLQLKRRPMEVSFINDEGDRMKTEKWLVSIEAHPDWVEKKLIETQAVAFPMLETTSDFTLNAPYREVFDESDDEPFEDLPPKEKGAARQQYQWEKSIIDKAVELQLVDKDEHAVGILEQSPFKSIPYGKLETNLGLAYIIAHIKVKEKAPEADTETRKNATRNLWDRDKKKLVEQANEMLGG